MKRKRRRPKNADEGCYTCPTCGETIVIPLDLTQGQSQQYVEDCPVCCNPNVVYIEVDRGGESPQIRAEPE